MFARSHPTEVALMRVPLTHRKYRRRLLPRKLGLGLRPRAGRLEPQNSGAVDPGPQVSLVDRAPQQWYWMTLAKRDGWQTLAMRSWTVGGGVIFDSGRILMVHNHRRGGRTDWSTPGGVIDEGETVLEGLTREVQEETGLAVQDWSGPVYTVSAEAIDMNWTLGVEVHLAESYSGELHIDDPDGIVRAAEWVQREDIAELLDGQQLWLREPLMGYLNDDGPKSGEYNYRIYGSSHSELRVERIGV